MSIKLTYTDINESCNRFAIYVRFHRVKEKLSLRDLAKMTGLSHTYLYKVEHNLIPLTKSPFEKITGYFNHRLSKNSSLDDLIESISVQFHEAIFYNKTDVIETMFNAIRPYENYYLNSLKIPEYLLILQGYSYMRNVVYDEKVTLYDDYLETLIDRFNRHQEALFYLYRGLSRYKFFQHDKALSDLIKVIDAHGDQKRVALASMIIGRIYSDKNLPYQAEAYLKKAKRVYEVSNHFETALYIEVYIMINLLKEHRLEGLEKELKSLIEKTKKPAFETLNSLVNVHLMYLYIRLTQYEDALLISHDVIHKTPQYYFYYVLANYYQKNTSDYANILKNLRKDSVHEEDQVYIMAIEALNCANNSACEHHFALFLKSYEEAYRTKKILDVLLLHPFIEEYYTNIRQYKQAYYLNRKLIEAIRGQ